MASISRPANLLFLCALVLAPARAALFDRDAGTGALTYSGAIPGLLGPTFLHPGGGEVYRTAGRAVQVYTREAGTGALTFLHEVRDGFSGVSLGTKDFQHEDEVLSMAFGPDGEVYVGTGTAVNELVRKPDGKLAFVQVNAERVGAAPAGAHYTTIASPDGLDVYASGGRFGTSSITRYEPNFTCASAPIGVCKAAGKASITLRDLTPDIRDKLVLSLLDLPSTPIDDFQPDDEKHFAVCLYDESGPSTLVLAALLPAAGDCGPDNASSVKPCWKETTKAVTYKDRWLSPDGVKTALLKPSDSDATKIKLKAQRENVEPPALPLGLPLRAQVQSADGDCWEAVFSTTKKNDAATFKAKIP